MSKMARNKGKRGERAVIDWLQPITDEIYRDVGLNPVLLQRNTVQSDRGGTDIVGLDWLAAEVKNVENDSPGLLDSWWEQCLEQSERWSKPGKPMTPVLFYMRNRRPIRVRMNGFACCVGSSPLIYAQGLVDISAEAFEVYFRARLRHELGA